MLMLIGVLVAPTHAARQASLTVDEVIARASAYVELYVIALSTVVT